MLSNQEYAGGRVFCSLGPVFYFLFLSLKTLVPWVNCFAKLALDLQTLVSLFDAEESC